VARFNPHSISIEQQSPAEPLAGALINALSRPLGMRQTWGVFKSLFLGLLTFGVAPLFSWIKGFYTFCAGEQQQFVHLAKWVSQNTDHPEARALEAHANKLRPLGILTFLSIAAMLATIGAIWYVIDSSGRPPEYAVLAGTYGFGKNELFDQPVWPFRSPFVDRQLVFGIWTCGLALAYGLHWLQVTLHAGAVKNFVARFSRIAEAEGVNRLQADPLGSTIRPLWMLGALCLIIARAPWGLLMMLAGAAQRRYIITSGRNTRADVAQRLRAMIERRRPGVIAPSPVYLRDRCIEPKCRAELPRGANFCRRCGTRQKAAVDRIV